MYAIMPNDTSESKIHSSCKEDRCDGKTDNISIPISNGENGLSDDEVDLHQEWGRVENVMVHRDSAIVAHTLEEQTAEHHRCEAPCAPEEDHNNLNNEKGSENSQIGCVPGKIGNIRDRSIFHITKGRCALQQVCDVSCHAWGSGDIRPQSGGNVGHREIPRGRIERLL